MPLYKNSAKDPLKRKFPFEVDTRLLDFAYYWLKTTDIAKYSKLHSQTADQKMNAFRTRFYLQDELTEEKATTQNFILALDNNHKMDDVTKRYEILNQHLYQMIFIVFTFMMETNYNGVIRQLCKLFLKKIEGTCREFFQLR